MACKKCNNKKILNCGFIHKYCLNCKTHFSFFRQNKTNDWYIVGKENAIERMTNSIALWVSGGFANESNLFLDKEINFKNTKSFDAFSKNHFKSFIKNYIKQNKLPAKKQKTAIVVDYKKLVEIYKSQF